MKNILISVALSFLLLGCATPIAPYTDQNAGIGVITLDVSVKAGSNIWFNYLIHYENIDTGETNTFRVVPRAGKKYQVLANLEPGNYRLVSRQSYGKDFPKTYARSIKGDFYIRAGKVTNIAKFIVKSEERTQYISITSPTKENKQDIEAALKKKDSNYLTWEFL